MRAMPESMSPLYAIDQRSLRVVGYCLPVASRDVRRIAHLRAISLPRERLPPPLPKPCRRRATSRRCHQVRPPDVADVIGFAARWRHCRQVAGADFRPRLFIGQRSGLCRLALGRRPLRPIFARRADCTHSSGAVSHARRSTPRTSISSLCQVLGREPSLARRTLRLARRRYCC